MKYLYCDNCGKYLLLVFLLLGLSASVLRAASDFFAGFPAIDPDSVIAKYGTPDIIDSSAYDNPRPPIVVKMFIYKKENVRLIFMANPPGAPPPYNDWRYIGAEDAPGKKVISITEALHRLSRRIKKP